MMQRGSQTGINWSSGGEHQHLFFVPVKQTQFVFTMLLPCAAEAGVVGHNAQNEWKKDWRVTGAIEALEKQNKENKHFFCQFCFAIQEGWVWVMFTRNEKRRIFLSKLAETIRDKFRQFQPQIDGIWLLHGMKRCVSVFTEKAPRVPCSKSCIRLPGSDPVTESDLKSSVYASVLFVMSHVGTCGRDSRFVDFGYSCYSEKDSRSACLFSNVSQINYWYETAQ